MPAWNDDSPTRHAAIVAILAGVFVLAGSWLSRPSGSSLESGVPYRVDINSAEWFELLDVEGVGDTLALRIVESRTTTGPFESVDELTRVRGIGEISMEKMRPSVRAGQ